MNEYDRSIFNMAGSLGFGSWTTQADLNRPGKHFQEISEEDKRATTNVQNGLVFFFLFSFILFYSLLLSLN